MNKPPKYLRWLTVVLGFAALAILGAMAFDHQLRLGRFLPPVLALLALTLRLQENLEVSPLPPGFWHLLRQE
jgi:hypothetical protein